jgi:hypothetical protein
MSANDEHDLARLAAIGDPFADDAAAPVRSLEPPRIPAGENASPTRSRVRAIRWIAFAAALLFEVPHLVFARHRRDVTAVAPAELAVGLGLPLAVAAVAFFAGTRRGARGLGLPARVIAGLAVAAPALFALGTLAGAPDNAPDPAFWQHAAGCASTTAVLALGPVALGLWAFRRAFAVAAPWRTAALGIAAGGIAAAVMSIACPITGAWHVLLGHGTMMLAAGLAGALLAPAVSRS